MPASPSPARPPCPFTAPERELIRHELGQHFGQLPSVADGLFLRNREAIRPEGRNREGGSEGRGGPQAGQPKLPPAIQTMLARGLVEVRVGQRWPWPRAFFTEAGPDALRKLARNPRLLDPERYAHVRHGLGLEGAEVEKGANEGTDTASASE